MKRIMIFALSFFATMSPSFSVKAAAQSKDSQSHVEWREKMNQELTELRQDIDELQEKVEKSSSSARTELEQQLAKLEKRRVELKKDLDETGRASGRAWDKMRASFQSAMKELEHGFKAAKKEFNATKPEAKPETSTGKKPDSKSNKEEM